MCREQDPGRRASVVPSGASRGLPCVVLPSPSPVSAGLPPSRGLWPGLDCRGPSHLGQGGPRSPVPICHPDEKLKSVRGRESEARKLRPVVFHGAQSGPGLGPRSV